jgi:hypothetical protein
MRYAIIADIHANLEAFNVVLADAKAMNCTHYACLGDVVGYNANPKECLDMVRAMNIPVVKGNHDEYCSSETDLEGFNPHAQEAINWTRNQLTDDDRKWLRDLRYIRLVASFSIVHATLDGPQRWGYVFDKLAAAASFTYHNRARHVIFRHRRQRRPAPRRQPQSCLRRVRPRRRLHRTPPPRLRHRHHPAQNPRSWPPPAPGASLG